MEILVRIINNVCSSPVSESDRGKEVSRSIIANFWQREKLHMREIISPENISGFVVGEGCFYVEFGKDIKYLLGTRVRPSFVIELAEDDKDILDAIQKMIGCGTVYLVDFGRYQTYYKKNWKRHVRYKVSNITDIAKKLIPFFKKYPLFGKKAKAFFFFERISEMVVLKKHLTSEGLKEISELVQQLHLVNKRGL